MDIGRMRHRITLQEFKETGRNRFNEPITERVAFATVWASIEPIVGREYWAKHQVQAEVTHRIRMRYREGVKPTMRVIFKEREFSIESVVNYQERNVDLQLMCKEVVT